MSEALSHIPINIWLPITALCLFFGFFVALLIQVYARNKQTYFEKMANLPLQENSHD